MAILKNVGTCKYSIPNVGTWEPQEEKEVPDKIARQCAVCDCWEIVGKKKKKAKPKTEEETGVDTEAPTTE